MRKQYQYHCVSPAGFIQALAVHYLPHGYYYYVTGVIGEGVDPEKVDRKLIDKYGCDTSKTGRWRRKARGLANVQYVRYGRFFVLLSTPGEHLFFDERSGEGRACKDIRRVPILFKGHQIGCTKGSDGKYHSSVRIEPQRYRMLRTRFIAISRWKKERLAEEFSALPYLPYARVKKQYFVLLKLVNEKRREYGFQRLTSNCLNLVRPYVKPFATQAELDAVGQKAA